jgi:hypothetical protein
MYVVHRLFCMYCYSCESHSTSMDGYADYTRSIPYFRRRHSAFDDTLLAISKEDKLVRLGKKVSTS